MDIKQASEHCERLMIKDALSSAIELTKLNLEGYRGQKEYVGNLIEQQAGMCQDVQSMTVVYGEKIGHGSAPRPAPGEILAEDPEYQELKHKLKEARGTLERIERITSLLAPTEKKIIELRYFGSKPEQWQIIAWKVGYSETQCRRLHVKALRFAAVSMFGMDDVYRKHGRFMDNIPNKTVI